MVPLQKLEPYAEWLVKQRVDGGWAPFKVYRDPFSSVVYYGKPTVSLTVRATDILLHFGYNFTNETLRFVIKERDSGAINNWTIDTALAIDYLCRFKFVPPVTLYEIENLLRKGNLTVITVGLTENQSREILNSLKELFGGNFKLSNDSEVVDYSIVIAPYGTYDVKRYNPYVPFSVENGTVKLANYSASSATSIAIIPGATANGMALFVLYGKNSKEMAIELFTTGFIKYLRGNAMLITNENGRIVQYVVG